MRLALLLFVGVAHLGFAANPIDVYRFETPEQQARYRALIEELRCPKCMNTNIAGSDAPIAQDLRATVHRMIVDEQLSDAEILAFMQSRYGDFVLYDPPFNHRTWLFWLLPVVVGMLAVVGLWRLGRRAARGAGATLSRDQRAQIDDLLSGKDS